MVKKSSSESYLGGSPKLYLGTAFQDILVVKDFIKVTQYFGNSSSSQAMQTLTVEGFVSVELPARSIPIKFASFTGSTCFSCCRSEPRTTSEQAIVSSRDIYQNYRKKFQVPSPDS